MADETSSVELRHATYAKLMARAWSDAAFKAKLLSDPRSALTAAGIEVPNGISVKVVEDTEDTRHLVLPTAPEGELTEEDLAKVGAGFGNCAICMP